MDVGHHAGDPAHVEVLAAWPFDTLQAFFDVPFHRWLPVPHVAHVDRKFPGVCRYRHSLLRQYERTLLAVERERGHAVTHGQHQRGLRAIDAVTRRHLFASRLQEIGHGHAGFGLSLAQHAEDRADADVHVDVAGAVQRIEHQQVFTLRVTVRDDVDAVHLLAGHCRQVTAPFVGLDQHRVGDDVELFLDLALHVFRLCRTQHATERALVHGLADALAGAGHHLQQQPQVGRNQVVHTLLLHQVAGQGNFCRCHVFLRQPAPAVERARQTRGQLRVEGVDLQHTHAPELVTSPVHAVERSRVATAVGK